MSHEIRTPLNAIVGFSELLQTTEDKEDKVEYMQIINSNNKLLLKLIEDILDLSKIESGSVELSLERFDFCTFFSEIYSTHKTRFECKDIEFNLINPYKKCIVLLDKNRLLQLISNYINNAIKFTISGHINMGYLYEDGGIKVYVEDSGIGIQEEKQIELFQRFGKMDEFAQGTGIGLSICKAISESMKGKVGASSKPGEGSTFWAWIPCEADIDHLGDNDNKNYHSNSNQEYNDSNLTKNILVAEDNDSNYTLIKSMLKDCELTRVVNGKMAVELAKKNKYDAILMDIRMPIMNGIIATKLIREFDKDTSIIAITANAFEADKKEALNAGCNDFICKPINKKRLELAISK